MRAPIRPGFLIFACLALPALSLGAVLPGHWRPEFAAAPLSGSVASDEVLSLDLGLAPADPAGLDQFLARVYGPHDPAFRHFLSPAEFSQRFSPSPAEYQAVLDFAAAHGFAVTKAWPNRLLVSVSARASQVEEAFHVRLELRQRPDGSLFHAPDRDPRVDGPAALKHVTGLDNWRRKHARVRPHPRPDGRPAAGTLHPKAGSGGNVSWGFGFYQGWDFRQAYVPDAPTSLQGSGQRIGLVEFQGFYQADVNSYCGAQSPPMAPPAIQAQAVDGFKLTPVTTPTTAEPSPDGDNVEVSLDIEVALSMAPQATVVAYEAPYTASINDVLAAMAQAPLCGQISCSWSTDGDATTRALLAQLAAQGQAFVNASGDFGAYGPANVAGPVAYPDSLSPYITEVGGTNLSTLGPSGGPGWRSYTAETTWNNYLGPCDGSGSGGASGGGICDTNDPTVPSSQLVLPAWQAGLATTSNGASNRWRNLPDVSAVAENFWVVDNNGNQEPVDGTSGAAPLWAGFLALVNQEAATAQRGPLGSPNTLLYELAKTPVTYAQDFHDIADHSTNGLSDTHGASCDSRVFSAVPGYDLATGLGSPAGKALVDGLVGVMPAYTPTPTFTSSPTISPTFTQSRTFTITPTFTSSPTISPTFSQSPTPTFTPPYLASGRGFSLLAPQPVALGRPLLLYFKEAPARSQWKVYNLAGELALEQDVRGSGPHDCPTQNLAPGVYFARIQVDYASGSAETLLLKIAVVP